MNIREHLQKLNLKKGDHICCHANLASFGFVSNGFCKSIIENILQIIDQKSGTLVMPFYRLTGQKKLNKKFFYKKSNSVLYGYFYKNYNVIMSNSVIHPHIGLGKNANLLKNCEENRSFGKNSDFNLFEKKNFKLLLLGCSPNEGATYLHHLEYIFNVPYRQKKKLILQTNKKIIYNYNILKNPKYTSNFDKILKVLKKKTKQQKIRFGTSYYLKILDIKNRISKHLKVNRYFLVKK